jgi:hypothetical protein
MEIVERQPEGGSTGGGRTVAELQSAAGGWASGPGRACALVRPLGPSSAFGRLRWGGPCVNCGETVPPGGRGWIEPTFQQVLCAECWPALVTAGV